MSRYEPKYADAVRTDSSMCIEFMETLEDGRLKIAVSARPDKLPAVSILLMELIEEGIEFAPEGHTSMKDPDNEGWIITTFELRKGFKISADEFYKKMDKIYEEAARLMVEDIKKAGMLQ